jgi:hypothetical protein
MRVLVALLTLAAVLASGCNDPVEPAPSTSTTPPPPPPEPMNFTTHRLPAVHQGHGLYEPTIDASPEGTLYVSAHSAGIGVAPAPGYVSRDGGATWSALAVAGSAALPPQTQGSAPLFSDEMFIVAGEDGQAWGVDINVRDYMVLGWCDDGADLCYYNPHAYDNTQLVLQADDCRPRALKDRPWAAYSNGTLLLVNNPFGGPVQLGAMKVPPALPADISHAVSGIQWNLCASSGGFIPGIPDIRPDGFFAVPQMQGGTLVVVTGNAADVMAVQEHPVFKVRNAPASQMGDYGQAVFDAQGTLYVGAMNNTGRIDDCGDVDPTTSCGQPEAGFLQLAYSTDGSNFTAERFAFDSPVTTYYLDGNRQGPGALLTWGIANVTTSATDPEATDYYVGHLLVEDGRLVLRNVNLAYDDGPAASRHVQGSTLGPDGRAILVFSDVSGNSEAAMAQAAGSMPLWVAVQQAGPTLTVAQ